MRLLAVLIAVILSSTTLLAGENKLRVQITKEKIDFLAGAEPITTYHIAPGFAKPIFWPLYAPGKVALTRAWPMDKNVPGEATDHIHQQSAWFCHGDVIPEGMELKQKIRGVEGVDFWSVATGHGKMVCTHVGEPQYSPVSGRDTSRPLIQVFQRRRILPWRRRFLELPDNLATSAAVQNRVTLTTKNEWRTADDQKIIDETRIITVVDYGKSRLIVLDIDLHASVVPIVFGDTKEGAMGIRINDQINAAKGKGQIKNAEGKVGEKECWGQFSNWCDYSGPIDGKTVGLCIFADAKNPHPTCWHSRGYGLMAANPFGRNKAGFHATKGRTDLVRLEKGAHLRMRYALLAHEGDTDSGQVAEYYRRFSEIPKN